MASNKNKKRGSRSSTQPKTSKGKSLWLDSILDPFDTPPAAVPDAETTPSYKTKLNTRFTFTPKNNADVTSLEHKGFLMIGPVFPDIWSNLTDPSVACSRNYDTGTGLFTGDVNVEANHALQHSAAFPSATSGIMSSRNIWKYRVTSMGVRITPEVPELSRGGIIRVGLIPNTASPFVNSLASSSKAFSPMLYSFGAYGQQGSMGNQTIASITARMANYREHRMLDGPIVVSAHPTGAPSYLNLVADGKDLNLPSSATMVPAVAVLVEGDMTDTASAEGHSYHVEVVWNVEIIGMNTRAHVIPLTPSLYSPNELAVALNGLQLIPAVVWGEMAEQIGMNQSGSFGPGIQTLAHYTERLVRAGYTFASSPSGQRILALGFNYLRYRSHAQRRMAIEVD